MPESLEPETNRSSERRTPSRRFQPLREVEPQLVRYGRDCKYGLAVGFTDLLGFNSMGSNAVATASHWAVDRYGGENACC